MKLLTALSVTPNSAETTSPTSLASRVRDTLSVIRWRNATGISRMSLLTRDHFEKYVREMQQGVAGLLPLVERAKEYIEAISRRGLSLPTYTPFRGSLEVAWTEIAQQLGLSQGQQLSPEARHVCLQYLALSEPKLHAAEMARLKLDEIEGSRPLSSARIRMALHPWELLWTYRPFMPHDPIGVRAFTGSVTRHSIGIAVGREVQRTEDVPPYQACYLLDRALTWIFEYAPTILEYLRVVAKYRNQPEAVRNREISKAIKAATIKLPDLPVRVLPSYQKGKFETASGATVRDLAYVLLPAACFIVISTFTARREGELMTLLPDCVEGRGDELWLLSWIEKTLRALDRTPIPPCVKKAIDTLRQLQDVTQDLGKPKRLFQFIEPTPTRRRVLFEANEAIEMFSEAVGLPALPDGAPCRLATHMFRRFFCITYYYRSDFPMLLALSFHLRHFDLEMTKLYVKGLGTGEYLDVIDKKRASRKLIEAAKKADVYRDARRAEFEEDRVNILARKFREILVGELWIGGRGGDRLVADLNDLIDQIGEAVILTVDSSVLDRRIDPYLIEFAKHRWLEPNPENHSLCVCGTSVDDLKLAQCLVTKERVEGASAMAGVTAPDHTYADRFNCGKCIHNAQTRGTLQTWLDALSTEQERQESAPTPEMRELADEHAAAIKTVLVRCASTANAPDIHGLHQFAK